MLDTSLAALSAIRKNNVIANFEKVKERAKNALSNGRNFTFPSVTSILGNPPTLPSNGNIYKKLEAAKELSSYYEVAAYMEGEVSKILKKKRA